MITIRKIVASYVLLFGLFVSSLQAARNSTNESTIQTQKNMRDEKGRTPFMNLIINFELRVKEIKYGNGSAAGANSMLYESYFLGGIYSTVGSCVSDVIESKVQYIAQQIKNETAGVLEQMKTMNIVADDFKIQDFDGKTVLQHCTTKEAYELLRSYGSEFKMNRAVRIYGRYYAPALLDYVIAYCVITSGMIIVLNQGAGKSEAA